MDLDPHSFSFMEPDPGGENLRGKAEIKQGKWKKIEILLQNFNLFRVKINNYCFRLFGDIKISTQNK